jgi:hypothetical protein
VAALGSGAPCELSWILLLVWLQRWVAGEDRCRLFALLGGGETLAKGTIYREIRASGVQMHHTQLFLWSFFQGLVKPKTYHIFLSVACAHENRSEWNIFVFSVCFAVLPYVLSTSNEPSSKNNIFPL